MFWRERDVAVALDTHYRRTKIGATHRGRRSPANLFRNSAGLSFLAPWLVGLPALHARADARLALSIVHEVRSPERAEWIGPHNYVACSRATHRFLQALKVTFIYLCVSRCRCKLAFALLLAVILDKGLRGGGLYRSLLYLPSLLGGSVAIAVPVAPVVPRRRHSSTAPLALFGIQGPSWISNPDTAHLHSHHSAPCGSSASPMVIFLAGLRQIPPELYEAASMDGASRWRQFRTITLPLLAPVIFFNLVLQIIDALQGLHAGLHHQRRHRRPRRLHPVLHALPVPGGVRVFPHGVCVRDGLGAADRHRRSSRRQLRHVEILGLLRR